jgi:RecA/RadA recombinase
MKTKADHLKKTRKKIVEQVKESARTPRSKPLIPTLPTSITPLDCALSGGVSIGQISNIVGDSSSGKTFLASEFIAAAYRLLGNKLEWFYDDVENRYSFNTRDLYGIDIIKKDQTNSHTIEDFTGNLKGKLSRLPEGKTLIYILDCFDMLSSKAEMERDKDKEDKGTYNLEKVKNLGKFFRLRMKDIRDKKCILIIISQVRENIGVTYGPKYYRTGGKALDHMASLIIWLAETEKHRKKGRVYGITTKARITKIGNDKPFREAYMEILFDYGVDNIRTNILYLYNLYTDLGKHKAKVESELFQWDNNEFSLKGLIHHIESNNLEKELAQKVIDKWEKIEASISSVGRKKKW